MKGAVRTLQSKSFAVEGQMRRLPRQRPGPRMKIHPRYAAKLAPSYILIPTPTRDVATPPKAAGKCDVAPTGQGSKGRRTKRRSRCSAHGSGSRLWLYRGMDQRARGRTSPCSEPASRSLRDQRVRRLEPRAAEPSEQAASPETQNGCPPPQQRRQPNSRDRELTHFKVPTLEEHPHRRDHPVHDRLSQLRR